MRILALDYGSKRIGVAVSDALGLTAQGKGVITRKDLREDLKKIEEYIDEYNVEKIIVGMPRNMDGSYGPRAEKTRQFITFLRRRLTLPVETWDERLSSAEAERVLISGDVSRAKRKKVIDQVAAAIILQGYLDSKDRGGNNNGRGK
ncbi:MAG: Holliday junction resolvase RuvX [Halanaerobiaceae bacterium]